MKFEDIYQFFRDPPSIYLSKKVAVCYVLSVLVNKDSYGTELMQMLEREHSKCRLSDTVLHKVFKFLESENVVNPYWEKTEGRGRPRKMYQIRAEWLPQAKNLAQLWHQYKARV